MSNITYSNFLAVCEKCGAIGVKHAFYTKERRFCSRACARSSENTALQVDYTNSPTPSAEQNSINSNLQSDVKPILTVKKTVQK